MAEDCEGFLAPVIDEKICINSTSLDPLVFFFESLDLMSGRLHEVVILDHDLGDLFEVLRLVFLHPQDLGGGEAGKCDVRSQLGQLFPLSVLSSAIVQSGCVKLS